MSSWIHLRRVGNSVDWECHRQKSTGCRGSLKTTAGYQDPEIIKGRNHLAE